MLLDDLIETSYVTLGQLRNAKIARSDPPDHEERTTYSTPTAGRVKQYALNENA